MRFKKALNKFPKYPETLCKVCMDQRAIKALVVDDSKSSVVLLSRLLEGLGVEVSTTHSAIEVVDLVFNEDGKYDIVFLDICMPKLSGNEVAKQLREKGFKGTIIAFTSTASVRGGAHSKRSGIDTYLSKHTINKELLTAILQTHCQEKTAS